MWFFFWEKNQNNNKKLKIILLEFFLTFFQFSKNEKKNVLCSISSKNPPRKKNDFLKRQKRKKSKIVFQGIKGKNTIFNFFLAPCNFFELLNLNESPILKRTPPSKSVEIQKKKSENSYERRKNTTILSVKGKT